MELKIRLLRAVSIGFRGLEHGLDPWMETDHTSTFWVEIFIGDVGRRLFAFWPDCGECFAPIRVLVNRRSALGVLSYSKIVLIRGWQVSD